MQEGGNAMPTTLKPQQDKKTRALQSRPLSLSVLSLLRPLEWSKGVFVLFPALFYDVSLVVREPALWGAVLASFVLFCLVASSVYVFNDLLDIEQDRKHPIKRRSRPLASGEVSKPWAWGIFVVLSSACFLLAVAFVPAVFPFLSIYWLLMLAYSAELKHWAIIDLFVIAFGFCLRVEAGAAALDYPASLWMLATTLCLSLFLAASKRRQETLANKARARRVLSVYSVSLIERYMMVAAVCTLMFYSFFATDIRPELGYTIPLVLFGFFRYLLLIERGSDKDSPNDSPTDLLFSDKPLLACVVVWAMLSMVLLWH